MGRMQLAYFVDLYKNENENDEDIKTHSFLQEANPNIVK